MRLLLSECFIRCFNGLDPPHPRSLWVTWRGLWSGWPRYVKVNLRTMSILYKWNAQRVATLREAKLTSTHWSQPYLKKTAINIITWSHWEVRSKDIYLKTTRRISRGSTPGRVHDWRGSQAICQCNAPRPLLYCTSWGWLDLNIMMPCTLYRTLYRYISEPNNTSREPEMHNHSSVDMRGVYFADYLNGDASFNPSSAELSVV